MPYLSEVNVREDASGLSLSLTIRLFPQDTTEPLQDIAHALTGAAQEQRQVRKREAATAILDALQSTLKQTPSSEQEETDALVPPSMSPQNPATFADPSLRQPESEQSYTAPSEETYSFMMSKCIHKWLLPIPCECSEKCKAYIKQCTLCGIEDIA